MTKKNLFFCAVAASLALSAPASAVTVTIADGETWCDSANKLSSTASCSNPNSKADLRQTSGLDSVTFAGSGTILGFVQDGPGLTANWADAAMITLNSASNITFSLEDPSDALFDGSFSFGGLVFADPIINATNSSLTFGVAAGTYAFAFDATAPNQAIANTSEYTFAVSAVPVPAAGLLLLTALGGFASVKRRKKATA
jgi:hypothetical protein